MTQSSDSAAIDRIYIIYRSYKPWHTLILAQIHLELHSSATKWKEYGGTTTHIYVQTGQVKVCTGKSSTVDFGIVCHSWQRGKNNWTIDEEMKSLFPPLVRSGLLHWQQAYLLLKWLPAAGYSYFSHPVPVALLTFLITHRSLFFLFICSSYNLCFSLALVNSSMFQWLHSILSAYDSFFQKESTSISNSRLHFPFVPTTATLEL